MLNYISSNSQLTPDILLLWAQSCEELEVKSSKVSGAVGRAKQCCFCGHVIKLGAGLADYSLVEHMRSKKCRKAQQALGDPVPTLY